MGIEGHFLNLKNNLSEKPTSYHPFSGGRLDLADQEKDKIIHFQIYHVQSGKKKHKRHTERKKIVSIHRWQQHQNHDT